MISLGGDLYGSDDLEGFYVELHGLDNLYGLDELLK